VVPVSAPSAAHAPITGATPSCQKKRVRAGASKATNPVMDAPTVIAAVAGVFSEMSTTAAIPTGIATRNPRRSAGRAGPRSRQLLGIEAMPQTIHPAAALAADRAALERVRAGHRHLEEGGGLVIALHVVDAAGELGALGGSGEKVG